VFVGFRYRSTQPTDFQRFKSFVRQAGCKQLVDRLNADPVEIRGRVERLGLIWSDPDMVRTIRSFDLLPSRSKGL
jgi:hypothetical protein